MASLDFYARDLYPDTGLFTTAETSIPNSDEQVVLENDDSAVSVSSDVREGGNKRNLFITMAGAFGIIAIITWLSN